ncbi:MAG: cyclic lactone autoinducer peptide [Tissierellia bacterium]|nr:cyclic lactone autoinducer peptide [Tissierellia bacterium]
MKFAKLSKTLAGIAMSLFAVVAATSTTYCLILAFEEPKMPHSLIEKQMRK